MKPELFSGASSGRIILVPGGYWAFVPKPLPPTITWTTELIAALSEADRAVGELAGLGRMLPNPHLLIRPFLRREAVLSSRIEGTRASLADVYAYEAVQMRLWENVDADDVREVINYVRALEYGLSRLEELPVSLRLIRELHAVLMKGVRGGSRAPGEFRRTQNWIGPPGCTVQEAVFVPPPVSELPAALDSFERFLHEETSLPPLIRAAMAHYQFEAIHPFLDGNGRLGRMLIVLLLCAWGVLPQPLLYVSAYFEANREVYYDCLQAVSTRGDWERWFVFFLKGIETQARDAVQRARKLQDLQKDYRERLERLRLPATALRVVDFLFERPLLNVSQVARHLGVTYQTANNHVKLLEKEGILQRAGQRRRNQLFVAAEVLAVIDEPLVS